MESNFSIPKYRADIDGLRAIAVLSVLLFHFFPDWIAGGFIGVDIFFVISGYLISTTIFENLNQETFSFKEFYSRRIRRIFPALIVVLALSYVIGWFTLFDDEFENLGKHIAGGAGFISNLILWKESGYFDVAAETKPLMHLWSLGIEEQFYIFFPFFIWFTWRRKLNLLTFTIVITIASFYMNIRGLRKDPIATFFSPQTRFWELMCGTLLAWIEIYKSHEISKLKSPLDNSSSVGNYRAPQNHLTANIASFSGILLLLYGVISFNKDMGFPGGWALLPVLGSILLISAGKNAWINNFLLSNPILVGLGLISYPLYLWHWIFLTFPRIFEGDAPNKFTRLSLLLLSIVSAWATYHLIERPIRQKKRNKVILTCLFTCMIAIAATGFFTYANEGLQFRTVAQRALDITHFKKDILGYKPCNVAELGLGATSLSYCQISTDRKPNSAIIGDSHAADKFYGLVKTDTRNNWMLIGNSSCPPVMGLKIEGPEKGCEEKFKVIFKFLANEKNITNVTLSFFGNYFKTEVFAADHVKSNISPKTITFSMKSDIQLSRKDMFFAGLNNAVKYLTAHGKKVTVVIDIPELPYFPRDCIRSRMTHCKITLREVMHRQEELREIIDRLKASNRELKVFDPISLMCSGGDCSFKKGDLIIYRDPHHLSLRGSKLYAERYIDNQNDISNGKVQGQLKN